MATHAAEQSSIMAAQAAQRAQFAYAGAKQQTVRVIGEVCVSLQRGLVQRRLVPKMAKHGGDEKENGRGLGK